MSMEVLRQPLDRVGLDRADVPSARFLHANQPSVSEFLEVEAERRWDAVGAEHETAHFADRRLNGQSARSLRKLARGGAVLEDADGASAPAQELENPQPCGLAQSLELENDGIRRHDPIMRDISMIIEVIGRLAALR